METARRITGFDSKGIELTKKTLEDHLKQMVSRKYGELTAEETNLLLAELNAQIDFACRRDGGETAILASRLRVAPHFVPSLPPIETIQQVIAEHHRKPSPRCFETDIFSQVSGGANVSNFCYTM